KKIKKRALVVNTERIHDARRSYCDKLVQYGARKILFLEEGGFNLHTSINYGYLLVNTDPILYQPASKGKNISISNSGLEHYQLCEGSFNREKFLKFLNN
ncbi:hypothetical protein A3Q56_06910, partial [Intoshia linei]